MKVYKIISNDEKRHVTIIENSRIIREFDTSEGSDEMKEISVELMKAIENDPDSVLIEGEVPFDYTISIG